MAGEEERKTREKSKREHTKRAQRESVAKIAELYMIQKVGEGEPMSWRSLG